MLARVAHRGGKGNHAARMYVHLSAVARCEPGQVLPVSPALTRQMRCGPPRIRAGRGAHAGPDQGVAVATVPPGVAVPTVGVAVVPVVVPVPVAAVPAGAALPVPT